jgi:hypothetical protein
LDAVAVGVFLMQHQAWDLGLRRRRRGGRRRGERRRGPWNSTLSQIPPYLFP